MLHESRQHQPGHAHETPVIGSARPKIAAIYARVSTTDQAEKGYSLPTQVEACVMHAMTLGYTVPESHIFQEDYTGTSLNRPCLRQLRDWVQQHAIQAVIVYDMDRLSRKLAHQLLLTEELEQYSVMLHIVTMPATDKSPESQLFSNMRGMIADYEREKILERTSRGRIGRAKAGFVSGGKRTLGYTYVRHADKGPHYDPLTHQCGVCGQPGDRGGCYRVDPEEAALVQRIFRLYVQDGLSLYAIAAHLTREGIPTQGDRGISGPRRTLARGLWHPGSLLEILRNETYVGTMYYGKTERLPGLRNPDKKTRWRWKPKADWIAVSVPAIIEQATFDAAQIQRRTNAQHSRRNRHQEYLLCNARLRCGLCGRVMTGEYNPTRQYRFYRCNGRRYLAGHPCKKRVNAAQIEQAVWAAVENVLRNPSVLAAELTRLRQGTQTQQTGLDHERHLLTAQVARGEKSLKRWEAAYVDEAIDLADFKAKKAEIDATRASLEQEIARLDAQQQFLEQAEIETTSLTAYCQRVQANLQRFDLPEKRLALTALSITATWHPEKPPEIRGIIPIEIASTAS